MDELYKCIGSLEQMRDWSDPYEVDADALDYAVRILKSLYVFIGDSFPDREKGDIEGVNK